MPETADRLEVILFGPGYGECALVGLGSGACSTADSVCSTALDSDEFLALVDLDARGGDQRRAVREFGVVLALLEDRGAIPRWASADRPLWRRTGSPDDGGADAEVVALTPSDATLTRSLHAFQRLLQEQGAPVRPRIHAVSPNLSSVVVWVRVGTDMAIFGGDLEVRTDRSIGWGAVVDSTTRPTGRPTLYKVPHHGSPNADAAEIRDELLAPAPTAILAPFTCGSVVRPDAEDVERICGHAGALSPSRCGASNHPSVRSGSCRLLGPPPTGTPTSPAERSLPASGDCAPNPSARAARRLRIRGCRHRRSPAGRAAHGGRPGGWRSR
jgi:hypothetical protein